MIFEKKDRKRTEKRVRERGRSRKKGLVKTVLEYSVGVLGLGIALTIAWFFPGWYSRWQVRNVSEWSGDARERGRDPVPEYGLTGYCRQDENAGGFAGPQNRLGQQRDWHVQL